MWTNKRHRKRKCWKRRSSSAWKRSTLPRVCRRKAQDDDSTANKKKRCDIIAADGPKWEKGETKVVTAWRFWRNTAQQWTNHNNGRINQSVASWKNGQVLLHVFPPSHLRIKIRIYTSYKIKLWYNAHKQIRCRAASPVGGALVRCLRVMCRTRMRVVIIHPSII